MHPPTRDSQSQSDEAPTVRKSNLPPTPPAQSGLEKRVASGGQDGLGASIIVEALKTSLSVIGPLRTTVPSLVDSVRKSQASPARFRGGASPARGNFSPGRNMACYQCGKLGHFKIECPERSPGLKVSFVSEEPRNDSGSALGLDKGGPVDNNSVAFGRDSPPPETGINGVSSDATTSVNPHPVLGLDKGVPVDNNSVAFGRDSPPRKRGLMVFPLMLRLMITSTNLIRFVAAGNSYSIGKVEVPGFFFLSFFLSFFLFFSFFFFFFFWAAQVLNPISSKKELPSHSPSAGATHGARPPTEPSPWLTPPWPPPTGQNPDNPKLDTDRCMPQ